MQRGMNPNESSVLREIESRLCAKRNKQAKIRRSIMGNWWISQEKKQNPWKANQTNQEPDVGWGMDDVSKRLKQARL